MRAIKNSWQRGVILSYLQKHHDHPSAEQLYREIVTTHPTISLATVYRNLNLLSETGTIQKISTTHGADRFDPNAHPHYHIHCIQCHQVLDADCTYLEEMDALIAQKNHCQILGHELLFEGICGHCLEEQKAKAI